MSFKGLWGPPIPEFLLEHAVAEFIDDLFPLDDREFLGVGFSAMGLGADEVMLLAHPVLEGLGDDPGGQPVAAVPPRRWADAVVFV